MKFHYGCLLSETGLRAENGRDGRYPASGLLDAGRAGSGLAAPGWKTSIEAFVKENWARFVHERQTSPVQA